MSSMVGRVLRGLLALSPAVVLRGARFGPRDAVTRLRDTYTAVNPLEGWESQEGDPLLPTVPVDAVLRGDRPELRLIPRHVAEDGSLAPWEILSLLMLARDRNPSGVLEIGTYFGATTLNLAVNLPEATIHTVDLPTGGGAPVGGKGDGGRGEGGAGEEGGADGGAGARGLPAVALRGDDPHLIARRDTGRAFRGTPEADRIVQHLGDTATIDLSSLLGRVSFCFIDGSHTYEYARNDTLRALTLIEGEGTVVWHDCGPGHPGVVRWLRELSVRGVPVRRVAGTTLAVAELDPRSALGRELIAEAPPIGGA